MAAEENFVLVRRAYGKEPGDHADIAAVVRIYLSERRANEDLELLRATDPTSDYEVQAIEYIDN